MIELNLLPDVKLTYIKTQRQRRLVLSVAVLVSIIAVVILALLVGVDGLQKKHLSDLNRDISNETNQLKGESNINQILTVQNQLQSLTALHASKPAATRLFNYLNEVTPANVSIDSFNIDFAQQTVTISGGADALKSINQYVDTLKDATYTTSKNKTPTPAFSNVVLSSFGLNAGNTNSSGDPSQAASYSVNFSYDKNLFDITQQNVNLNVPALTINRLNTTQQPTDLFKASSTSNSGSGGQ